MSDNWNFQRMWAIAGKDARELLRDRRTLFVNLGLPVLLYPLLALLAMQLAPLTAPQRENVPSIAILDSAADLQSH